MGKIELKWIRREEDRREGYLMGKERREGERMERMGWKEILLDRTN